MESTSCDSKLLHARRKVPLVKPSAHLAFRTTRHTDVPPSLGCTPSLSSSGSSEWISRNASACKNALATSNDIQQHPSWSELTPLERTSQAVRNGGDPARKSSRLSCASFISTNQHSTQVSPFSSCPLLCCTQLLVMSGQPCDEATSRGALSYTAPDLTCSSPSARPRATPLVSSPVKSSKWPTYSLVIHFIVFLLEGLNVFASPWDWDRSNFDLQLSKIFSGRFNEHFFRGPPPFNTRCAA